MDKNSFFHFNKLFFNCKYLIQFFTSNQNKKIFSKNNLFKFLNY